MITANFDPQVIVEATGTAYGSNLTIMTLKQEEQVICKVNVNGVNSVLSNYILHDWAAYKHEYSEEIVIPVGTVTGDRKEYNYTIGCEDRAGNLFDTVTKKLQIDLTRPLDITVLSPNSSIMSTKTTTVRVGTNKRAQCWFTDDNTITDIVGDGRALMKAPTYSFSSASA